MISVRLSTAEYLQLKQLSDVSGEPNLSDVARRAIRLLLRTADAPAVGAECVDLHKLDQKVRMLDREVERLGQMVAKLVLVVILCVFTLRGADVKGPSSYVLGPGDLVGVSVLDLEELEDRKARVDLAGYVTLPSAGRIHAAGLTTELLEGAIAERLRRILQEPVVTVSIEEFRSQPVSVLGAVTMPGIVQLQGRKTLFEVLSQAGGLKVEAGNTVVITRQKQWGPIPLPNAKQDAEGDFSIAEVSVKSIMSGKNPQENILVEPDDVISVPKAELVYVIGAVKKPGGYVLNERDSVSILQALSMAEGLDRAASAKTSKILRSINGSSERTEIPVDIKQILTGKAKDLPLLANDILFIPTSAMKNAAIRGAEAAITIGTGLAIYRP